MASSENKFSPGYESGFQETRPDALEAARVLRMEAVVAADARVLQHLVVVRQAGGGGGGGATAAKRGRRTARHCVHDAGGAGRAGLTQVDHGAAQGPRQRPYAAENTKPFSYATLASICETDENIYPL